MASRKKQRIPDWCVMAGQGVRCLRCGGYEAMPLPMPVDAFQPWCEYFGARHALCRDTGRVDTPPASVEEWATGWDTGTSSFAIYRHMLGLPDVEERRDNYPLDPDDFGRCYRLLKIAPEWRGRISEMAQYSSEWAGLAAAWDELTALYEEESPNRTAPKLYARMKELTEVSR